MNAKGSADGAIRSNIMRAKRQLVMPRLILRWNVLSIKTRVKLLEKFVEPILLYRLFTIVYHKVDGNKLEAV